MLHKKTSLRQIEGVKSLWNRILNLTASRQKTLLMALLAVVPVTSMMPDNPEKRRIIRRRLGKKRRRNNNRRNSLTDVNQFDDLRKGDTTDKDSAESMKTPKELDEMWVMNTVKEGFDSTNKLLGEIKLVIEARHATQTSGIKEDKEISLQAIKDNRGLIEGQKKMIARLRRRIKKLEENIVAANKYIGRYKDGIKDFEKQVKSHDKELAQQAVTTGREKFKVDRLRDFIKAQVTNQAMLKRQNHADADKETQFDFLKRTRLEILEQVKEMKTMSGIGIVCDLLRCEDNHYFWVAMVLIGHGGLSEEYLVSEKLTTPTKIAQIVMELQDVYKQCGLDSRLNNKQYGFDITLSSAQSDAQRRLYTLSTNIHDMFRNRWGKIGRTLKPDNTGKVTNFTTCMESFHCPRIHTALKEYAGELIKLDTHSDKKKRSELSGKIEKVLGRFPVAPECVCKVCSHGHFV